MPRAPIPSPTLSPQLFALFTAFIEDHVGLSYSPSDRSLFSDKLWTRITEAGFERPLDYYYFLRYDPAGSAELAALVDVLVVGETYLFRERDALRSVVDNVIRPAVEARGRARVWCAGCSTGEEPFSLAMLLADANLADKVDLTATDLSGRSLARARTGVVPARSLRIFNLDTATPAPEWAKRLVDRWVTPTERGGGVVAPEIRSLIRFEQDNLVAPQSSALDDLDLILCRNVLIYFRDDLVRRIISLFTERLRVGGRLLIGASESLLRFGTALRCEERSGVFLYAKDSE